MSVHVLRMPKHGLGVERSEDEQGREDQND
jgi:hypothetical protein